MNVRYTLKSLDWFKWCMENPGRGAHYTVRDLEEASGVSRSQIGRVLTGELDNLDVNDAHAVVEAFGVSVLNLFRPPASPKEGRPDNGKSPT